MASLQKQQATAWRKARTLLRAGHMLSSVAVRTGLAEQDLRARCDQEGWRDTADEAQVEPVPFALMGVQMAARALVREDFSAAETAAKIADRIGLALSHVVAGAAALADYKARASVSKAARDYGVLVGDFDAKRSADEANAIQELAAAGWVDEAAEPAAAAAFGPGQPMET